MRVIIALLLLLLAAAAPPPAVPVYKTLDRWIVACDNTRSCEARGFDDASSADLRVLRAAGDARPTVILSTAETPPDGSAIRLDGAPLPLSSPAWTRGDASPGNPAQLSTDNSAAMHAFIVRARDGHTLQLGGPESDTVPLDGFTAALLFMDAAQGRAGTPVPLAAPAGAGKPLPSLALPQLPAWRAPPRLSEAEERAVQKRARMLPPPAGEPCDQTEVPDTYALNAVTALVLRPCTMFAYQGSSLVYVVPRHGTGAARPVSLPLPRLPKDQSDMEGPEMTEPSFDPATGQLSTVYEGRGPADCGLAASWIWHAGGFRLLSLSFQDHCGGSGPGDWPILYRAAGGQT